MSINVFKSISVQLFILHKSPQSFTLRYARTRHRPIQFATMNNYQPWAKVLDIKEIMGDFDQNNASEIRDQLRRLGALPLKTFSDMPLNLSCTTGVFDDYVPPEGDGKSSLLSLGKLKESSMSSRISVTNITESRKIRKFEPEFSRSAFVNSGEQIYREMLSLLPNHAKEQQRLLELVTERGLGEMLSGLENKTLVHKFMRMIEPTRLVKVKTQAGVTEGQLFGQVILRMFSEQVIGIFDRFGRLIYGSDTLPVDVLEYVVFEKQVSEEFGAWRIHAKIIPDWLPKKMVYRRTMRVGCADEVVCEGGRGRREGSV